jgi:membrane-bound metal-dependent hydrolase YbcI (DUF457 family)
MPSTIGHAVAGLAIAWTGDRRADNRIAVLCAVVAALPDLDLVVHLHRAATHSIGAVIVVALIAGATAAFARRPVVPAMALFAAAYGSHLLLDWLAIDRFPPYGLQALWPFSNAWYISGWDLFPQTERRHFLSARALDLNVRAVLWEVAILAPVLLGAWIVRRARVRGSATTQEHTTERTEETTEGTEKSDGGGSVGQSPISESSIAKS